MIVYIVIARQWTCPRGPNVAEFRRVLNVEHGYIPAIGDRLDFVDSELMPGTIEGRYVTIRGAVVEEIELRVRTKDCTDPLDVDEIAELSKAGWELFYVDSYDKSLKAQACPPGDPQ